MHLGTHHVYHVETPTDSVSRRMRGPTAGLDVEGSCGLDVAKTCKGGKQQLR